MGGKLSTVEMFETAEDLQVLSVKILPGSRRISHTGMPQILIEQGDVLLDGGREVSIISDIAGHSFATVVIDLV
jgi:hypothetical protein